jgi:uncharacterized protein YkwD
VTLPSQVLAGVLLALGCAGGAGAAAETTLTRAAEQVVEGTNAFRESQGLHGVKVSSELQAAAREFSAYMARTGKYGHRADGRRPSERAAAHGYDYCIVSENIAYQYRSAGFESAGALAEAMVEGWKESPEHRANMLDRAVTQTGISIAQGDGGRYFAVQMFGRPKDASLRFSVQNRSGENVEYRAGKHRFTLAPRTSRSHTVCRPFEVVIRAPGGREAFTVKVSGGERYTVTPEGVLTSRR